jgi:hypothetical protein
VVFSDVMALGRSLWRQGLVCNYRKEYWKFLAQTVRRHRHHFSKAITLAIMGHHFFELISAEGSVSCDTSAAMG